MPLPIGPDYHFDIKLATDPALSPDGAQVAYTVRGFDRDTMKERVDVFAARLSGSEATLLVENAEKSAWSPDGASLAFLRADDEGRKQVWIAAADGSNPRQLTGQPGIDCFAWAPDSRRIAYRADVDPYLAQAVF